jgi:hypothetical protein
VIGDIIEIGRLLTEVKKIAGHGNWLPWLDREFGWSDSTALHGGSSRCTPNTRTHSTLGLGKAAAATSLHSERTGNAACRQRIGHPARPAAHLRRAAMAFTRASINQPIDPAALGIAMARALGDGP